MLEFLDVSAVVLRSRVERRRVHGRVEKSPEEPGDRRGGYRGEIFVAVGRGQIRGRAGGGMFSQM